MTRSHKRVGAVECLSDDFATTGARKHSRKSYRKKVRGVFGTTGKEIKVELECEFPARDEKFWKPWMYTEAKMEEEVELRDRIEELKTWENLKQESKRNMKQSHHKEKFESWCDTKSKRVIRKKQKKLEREGMETPYDNDSTDSEVDVKVEKAFGGDLTKLKEVKKYFESDSLMSFSAYRELKTK